MVSHYHSQVEKGLVEWCKSSKRIKETFKGNETPLSIVDAHTKMVVNYKPDVYAIKKSNNKKIIFEVLETELKKQDIIIADVIRSCLVENVDKIIFIFPSEEEDDVRRVLEALYTTTRGLSTRLKVRGDRIPTGGAYPILRNLTKDTKKVVKKIQEYSKKDGW